MRSQDSTVASLCAMTSVVRPVISRVNATCTSVSLSASSDEQVLLSGTRHARRIFAASPLVRHSAAETMPGFDMNSDGALVDFMHRAGMNLHHPVGTCRMGEDPMAVVDSRLRVRGVAGLRVVDASVMPTVTTGNTNAPTIMIGEKGATMIREDAAAA